MDLAHVMTAITGVLGLFLLGMTYTYIEKLENIGCACAEHKYRNFIKVFTIVAFVMLALGVVFPPSAAVRVLGSVVGRAYEALMYAFALALIVYFVMVFVYVRYLMREKCRCSEDIRREVMYIWAILEIILIAALFVFGLVIVLISSSVAMAVNTIDEVKKTAPVIPQAALDPVNSVMKVTKSVSKSLKKASRK